MKTSRMYIIAAIFLAGLASVLPARSLLEKKMFYVTSADGKTGETSYWFVFLGKHGISVNRPFPGEGTQKISGDMNFSLLSSGYVEGNGYSNRGKFDCLPSMKLKTGQGITNITIDSIDCIYEYGAKTRLVTGEEGEFIIDAEGQQKNATRFILTTYKMLEIDGEKELKPSGPEIPLYGIAFTKEGLERLKKAHAGTGTSEPAK